MDGLKWWSIMDNLKVGVKLRFKAPLAHSLGSASIIAHTIHQKFNLKVPNYRQEEDWKQAWLANQSEGNSQLAHQV